MASDHGHARQHNKRLLRSRRPRWSMVPQAAVVENRRAKLLEAEQVKGPPSVQIEDANVLRAPLLHHREMAAVALLNDAEGQLECDELFNSFQPQPFEELWVSC